MAFAGGGFAATSMEDVAAAAGVTRLIVYRHFESKEALYEAVLAQVTERLALGFGAYREQGMLGSEAAVRAFLEGAREDPAAFSLLWRQAAREARFADHAAGVRAGAVEVPGRTGTRSSCSWSASRSPPWCGPGPTCPARRARGPGRAGAKGGWMARDGTARPEPRVLSSPPEGSP